MAKCYFTCQTLFMCLFLYVRISIILGQSDFFRYDLGDPYYTSDERVELELLGENRNHNVRRRDTSNTTAYTTNATTAISKPEKPTQLPKKVVSSVPLQKSISNLPPTIQIPLRKNLGENGTGILHTTTKPPSPSLHVEPINATSNQKTTVSVNKNTASENVHHHEEDADDEDVDVDDNFSIPSDYDTEKGSQKFNESLSKHNVTSSKTDPNIFYNTSILDDPNIGHFYWVDMTNRTDVKVNELLSSSHRRAATVKLLFNFPFYGHLIKNVTIATGGFLYTGDYVHSWLAATQYIAPLMANFDTSLSNHSFIKYVDNGTAFTVEWEKVVLQDKPDEGEFTFQVTLFDNGNIVFVYKDVPVRVDQIQELHHPVKVGLSDAYIMDQTVFLMRRKTIYEYDRVNFNKTYIKSWTTISLKALPTCLDAQDCNTCLSRNINHSCHWCPSMAKCSQGFDRHRQNWLAHGCDKTSFNNVSICSELTYQNDQSFIFDHSNTAHKESPTGMALAGKVIVPSSQNDVGMSGILAILFLVGMVSGLTFWVFYAYRNPHTTSGQILIRYRPSQWRWRRGEARYTAATIHM